MLCLVHRKPKMEEFARFEFVMAWAKAHWLTLEPQALEQQRKAYAEQQNMMQGAMSQMAAAQQAAIHGNSLGLGGVLSGLEMTHDPAT